MAVVSCLTMLNRISDEHLDTVVALLNEMDGSIRSGPDSVRSGRADTAWEAGAVDEAQQKAFDKLRLVLMVSGVCSEAFNELTLTRNMAPSSMYDIQRLESCMQDLCQDDPDAWQYFLSVQRDREVGQGRRLVFSPN